MENCGAMALVESWMGRYPRYNWGTNKVELPFGRIVDFI